MSKPFLPQPVKLIVSLLTAERALVEPVCGGLVERFGAVDFTSEPLPFQYTRYYEPEMGAGLIRHLVSFQELISADLLPSIKRATNSIEDTFADDCGRRRINIDPGYVALSHVILATCKGFAHRPYLRDGVYADLTLIFRAQTFRALEWTFPDYGSAEMIQLLNTIRDGYLKQLRSTAPHTAQSASPPDSANGDCRKP